MRVTRILDGPAAWETFETRRAPMYVRVVRDRESGRWDVLDQLGDTPKYGEDVFVYEAVPGSLSVMCVRPGGRFEGADYREHLRPPAEDVVRSTARWREWASRQPRVGMLSDGMRRAIAQARAQRGRRA